MPIAAREGHGALGANGACHLETAGQAVHAGGCLPGEDLQAEQWVWRWWATYHLHPTALGTTESWGHPLLGILESCCP